MQKIIYLAKKEESHLPDGAPEYERIDAAVRWINRKVESTVHFGLLQIGYYLLNNFFDGKIDETVLAENGVIKKVEKDSDYDGEVDQWIEY